jgi:hypothetical protein
MSHLLSAQKLSSEQSSLFKVLLNFPIKSLVSNNLHGGYIGVMQLCLLGLKWVRIQVEAKMEKGVEHQYEQHEKSVQAVEVLLLPRDCAFEALREFHQPEDVAGQQQDGAGISADTKPNLLTNCQKRPWMNGAV